MRESSRQEAKEEAAAQKRPLISANAKDSGAMFVLHLLGLYVRTPLNTRSDRQEWQRRLLVVLACTRIVVFDALHGY